jgi:DNA-binding NarL/FixJ family response regulator
MKKRIVLCDDHVLFLEGLEKLIGTENNYEVIASYSHPASCIEFIKKSPPDIFICDLNLEKVDGFEIISQLKPFLSETLIIILTAYNEDFLMEKARKMGIHCFVQKSASKEEFFEIFKRTPGDEFYTNIAKSPNNAFSKNETDFKQKFKLSAKEIEIIKLVAKGKTSQEIGDQLFLSRFTIETHRRNIGKKLGISGITSLIQFANENHLLD